MTPALPPHERVSDLLIGGGPDVRAGLVRSGQKFRVMSIHPTRLFSNGSGPPGGGWIGAKDSRSPLVIGFVLPTGRTTIVERVVEEVRRDQVVA